MPLSHHMLTLANSIIGVSVLAMPFCFKECGIILAILLLIASCVLTQIVCHLLLKSAVLTRRRSYELLAFHTFGPTGKLLVELSIIGFLVGTCVAFFVVIGDLGPPVVVRAFRPTEEGKPVAYLRTVFLVALALSVALPLGLLRNVDSLSSISALSIGFYACLVLKVIQESGQHLHAGDWLRHVNLWQPSGMLRCVPIFSMALCCQTQLFEIYASLPDPSLHKMNDIVKGAVHMCTGVYICVGFFGYIAYCTQNFTGNILVSFSESLPSEAIRIGFILSIAVSFPLVVFPCRASIHSLLYRRGGFVETGVDYIPEQRFRIITIGVILLSLLLGIYIPNIELVLGLVGSTIGTVICIVLPAVIYIRATGPRNTFERLMAQVVLCIGIVLLVSGTYVNLYAADQANNPVVEVPPLIPIVKSAPIPSAALSLSVKKTVESVVELPKEKPPDTVAEDKRHEPPVPVEPAPGVQLDLVKKEEPSEAQVDAQAIRKEEEEIAHAEELPKPAESIVENPQEELLRKMEVQNKEQQKIIQEQKKILAELKEHQQRDHQDNDKPDDRKLHLGLSNADPPAVNKDSLAINDDPHTVNQDSPAVNKNPHAVNQDSHTINQGQHAVNQDPQVVNQNTHNVKNPLASKNVDPILGNNKDSSPVAGSLDLLIDRNLDVQKISKQKHVKDTMMLFQEKSKVVSKMQETENSPPLLLRTKPVAILPPLPLQRKQDINELSNGRLKRSPDDNVDCDINVIPCPKKK